MNWVDLVILALIGLFALWGWQRGFVFVVIDIIGLAASLLGALLLYGYVAALLRGLTDRPGLPQVIAFVLVFFLINALFWMVYRKAMGHPTRRSPSRVNAALGAILGAAEGVIICAAAVMALVSLPTGVTEKAVTQSRIGAILLDIGAQIDRAVTAAIPEDIREGLTFITITPDSSERIEIPPRENISIDAAAESRMLVLVNRERVERGLPPLRMDGALRAVARRHSRDMFTRGYFGHIDPDGQDPFDRLRQGGVRFTTAGENVALAPTVQIAHEGLMESPGHRANILRPAFRRAGIGVYISATGGRIFTQKFAN